MNKPTLSLLLLFVCAAGRAKQETQWTVPHVFGNHVVLQVGQPFLGWGWATPVEVVTETLVGQARNANAAPDGAGKSNWFPRAISTQPADSPWTEIGGTPVL